MAAEDQASLSPDQIRKAVSTAGEGGRLLKVLFLDEGGEAVGDWHSSQLPENPFSGFRQGQASGLQEPPFSLEQLVYLAETHPVHSAALEQKTADICGTGWSWEAGDDEGNEDVRDELDDWFAGLAPDEYDIHEVISAVWLDVETIGWGLLELARGPGGDVRRVYHVPGHTVRAHRDGFKLCQIRDERKVWFRRWGAPDVNGARIDVDAKTGSTKAVRAPANDLFVIKRPSRRSTWYGIPGYVSAIGWITLALAARDDNLFFFANRREPRWAIMLSNLADDPELEDDLRRAFVVDLKQPHRNLLIPITGPGKVEFQKLSELAKDGSFEKLSESADKRIMIAHRVPGERLANAQVGPLGGNATVAASRVYKDGVVTPGQELLAKRLNRLIEIEYELALGKVPEWELVMDDLDLDDERQDLDLVVSQFTNNLISLREARADIKRGPLMVPVKETDPETGEETDVEGEEEESEFNDKLYGELPSKGGGGGGGGPNPLLQQMFPEEEDPEQELANIGEGVRRLLWENREHTDHLANLINE